MVHPKALAMDNLLNSSNNIPTRASRHLRHQHNSRHRRSDGIGEGEDDLYNDLCLVIH